MQTFLNTCKALGLDSVGQRKQRLAQSIPALQSENVLFFICGHDFIHNPSDAKFRGIDTLFVKRNSPYELNLYGPCIDAFYATLNSPGIGASLEGRGAGGSSGVAVAFDPRQMVKAGGVRSGGAGNYNLQTKALEVIVTHTMGLDKDGGLQYEIIRKLQGAFSQAPGTVGAIAQSTLGDMRTNLQPYWGGDLAVLGL